MRRCGRVDGVARLLVILDLDETLVHVPEQPLSRPPDFRVRGYPAYRRPHLESFLKELRGRYEVAIWTTAVAAYAEAVVAEIIPFRSELAFLWSAEECVVEGGVKALRRVAALGFDLARVLVVDDSPEKLPEDSASLVRVTPFLGASDDTELPFIAADIHRLAEQEDVRTIEKGAARRHRA